MDAAGNPEAMGMAVGITQVAHGSRGYEETVALRTRVLRTPLGLEFSPEELAAEKDSFHLACRRDGRLVACLILKPVTAEQVRMRQFAVHPDFQGLGIGRDLFDHAESFAADHGYGEIVLHARETAVVFYGKMGCRIEGGRFLEVNIPHFRMAKRLRGQG